MSEQNETPLQALSKKERQQVIIKAGPQRQFTGEVSPPKEDKTGKAFHTKMLKAYLKGEPIFKFGYEDVKYQNGIVKRVAKEYLVHHVDKTVSTDAVERLLADGYTDPKIEFITDNPQFKRTSHAEIKDRKFQKSEDEREKAVEAANKEIKAFNKGKKKADKKALLVFNRRMFRPGSEKAKLAAQAKLGL